MEIGIRGMKPADYPYLRDFLYEAIFVPEGAAPPSREIIDKPELQVYIQDFGEKPDDCALMAVVDGKPAGAVWTRIMQDYGHLDDKTPSLAIALYPQYRGWGIGTALMQAILGMLRAMGYPGVSLSVQRSNYAAKMYQKLGFQTVRQNGEEDLMLYSF